MKIDQLTTIEPSSLASMTTDELKRHLAQAIGVTAQALKYMSVIWRELEERGEDLSDLRSGLMIYLPLIADGKLIPELVVRCAGQAMLLRAAAELPVADQERLLEHGARVMEVDENGIPKENLVALEHIRSPKIRLIFNGDSLRSPVEQLHILSREQRSVAKSGAKTVNVAVKFSASEYEQVASQARKAGQQVRTYLRGLALGTTNV